MKHLGEMNTPISNCSDPANIKHHKPRYLHVGKLIKNSIWVPLLIQVKTLKHCNTNVADLSPCMMTAFTHLEFIHRAVV